MGELGRYGQRLRLPPRLGSKLPAGSADVIGFRPSNGGVHTAVEQNSLPAIHGGFLGRLESESRIVIVGNEIDLYRNTFEDFGKPIEVCVTVIDPFEHNVFDRDALS